MMRLRLELFVHSVPDSMDFYTRVLGFEMVTYQPDDYSVFRKGNVQIALQSQSQLSDDHPLKARNQTAGLGIEIVLEVEDVDAAYERVQQENWQLADTLVQRPWGLRDFRVFDPNGFYIRVTEMTKSEKETIMMQAIISTKQELQLQQIEKPQPKEDEILVKVHAATVTAGDVVMKKMPAIAFVALPFMGMKRKRTPGHEFAGTIEAVGQAVTRFKVGDAVFGTTTGLSVGANAEYLCLPETGKTHVITHKPENISFEQAAALPVGSMTALQILQKADIQAGQKVLIYGASGSVGTYAVQLAKYLGAEVAGVCSTRNVDMVKTIGADYVIDYKQEDFTQNHIQYDVIFDAVGKLKEASIKQSLTEESQYLSTKTMTHETLKNLTLIAQLAQEAKITAVIDRCYSLAETADAYRYVASGRKSGNVVIQVTS